MSGAISPLPNTPSWRGAHLKKTQDSFTLYIGIGPLFCKAGRQLNRFCSDVAWQEMQTAYREEITGHSCSSKYTGNL
jgi:hypothetical protein